ncbi:hypothetical protein BSKO_04759 [Bryopsis sp. KO-2023]|nr:hypothetical protein BSKO_04759 [Bryopsis sp. KO-2023]
MAFGILGSSWRCLGKFNTHETWQWEAAKKRTRTKPKTRDGDFQPEVCCWP